MIPRNNNTHRFLVNNPIIGRGVFGATMTLLWTVLTFSGVELLSGFFAHLVVFDTLLRR